MVYIETMSVARGEEGRGDVVAGDKDELVDSRAAGEGGNLRVDKLKKALLL